LVKSSFSAVDYFFLGQALDISNVRFSMLICEYSSLGIQKTSFEDFFCIFTKAIIQF